MNNQQDRSQAYRDSSLFPHSSQSAGDDEKAYLSVMQHDGVPHVSEESNDVKRIERYPSINRTNVPELMSEGISPNYALSSQIDSACDEGIFNWNSTGHARSDLHGDNRPTTVHAQNDLHGDNGPTIGHDQNDLHSDNRPTTTSEYVTEHSSSHNYQSFQTNPHHFISSQQDQNQVNQQGLPRVYRGMSQLEVLYDARGRQINDLRLQLADKADDTERHIRILRHEKVLVESERDELRAHLNQLEVLHKSMEVDFSTVQGQLAAEKIKSLALENNKAVLVSQLQAAESTVNSLTNQVGQLTSSDTLSRIRDNYSQALSAAAHEHEQEVVSLQQEAKVFKEQLEERNETISQLKQEIKDLHEEESSKQHLTKKPPSITIVKNVLRDKATEEPSITQQLHFECEGSEDDKVVELTVQVEDLMFQLATIREELQVALERLQQTEEEYRYNAPRLSELELINTQLSDRVNSLQVELEEVKVLSEADKKSALDRCRSACLQLHEDSTQRMKESLATDKQRQNEETTRQIEKLKIELAAVQEQYVNVCLDKDGLETEVVQLREGSGTSALQKAQTEWTKQQQAAIQVAVGEARSEWSQTHEVESKVKVESILKEKEEIWQKRFEIEKSQLLSDLQSHHQQEMVVARKKWEEVVLKKSSKDYHSPTRVAKEKEDAVSEALRKARLEWLKERKMSIESRVNNAVGAARKLWKEHHHSEMEKFKVTSGMPNTSGEHEGQRLPTIEEALKEERKKMVEEISLIEQESEHRHSTNLQQVIATEKQKWESENEEKWKEHEKSLITMAHKEWSVAQDAVLKAEVERSQQEWEESMNQKKMDAVKDALLKAKQYYDGVLQTLHSELSRKHAVQKSSMIAEIQQLETKLATLLKQSDDQLTTHGHSLEGGATSSTYKDEKMFGDEIRGIGQCDEGRGGINMEQVRELLKTTSDGVMKDVISLLATQLEATQARHKEEIIRTRNSTAKKVKHYYLQCLHQLVNPRSHDISCDRPSDSVDQVGELRLQSPYPDDISHDTKVRLQYESHDFKEQAHDLATRSHDHTHESSCHGQTHTLSARNSQAHSYPQTTSSHQAVKKHNVRKSSSSSLQAPLSQKHHLISSQGGSSVRTHRLLTKQGAVDVHRSSKAGKEVDSCPSSRPRMVHWTEGECSQVRGHTQYKKYCGKGRVTDATSLKEKK